jgi:hypothetical protein
MKASFSKSTSAGCVQRIPAEKWRLFEESPSNLFQWEFLSPVNYTNTSSHNFHSFFVGDPHRFLQDGGISFIPEHDPASCSILEWEKVKTIWFLQFESIRRYLNMAVGSLIQQVDDSWQFEPTARGLLAVCTSVRLLAGNTFTRIID